MSTRGQDTRTAALKRVQDAKVAADGARLEALKNRLRACAADPESGFLVVRPDDAAALLAALEPEKGVGAPPRTEEFNRWIAIHCWVLRLRGATVMDARATVAAEWGLSESLVQRHERTFREDARTTAAVLAGDAAADAEIAKFVSLYRQLGDT